MNKNLLKQVYGHPLLSETDYTRIFDAHEQVFFDRGEYILKGGQVAESYFIVESGLIRSYVNDFRGQDITTNFFFENELVIEASSLFQRIPSQEHIEALSQCVCWKMDFDNFQMLFHAIEGIREWGRSWMSKSLFECKQRSVSMITDSATQRYLTLLETRPKVVQQAPLKHIATYLGITDTSLSRIRKETAKH